jgi:hypothetical protein
VPQGVLLDDPQPPTPLPSWGARYGLCHKGMWGGPLPAMGGEGSFDRHNCESITALLEACRAKGTCVMPSVRACVRTG